MADVIANVADAYDAKDVAQAMPVLLGLMLYRQGQPVEFACHALFSDPRIPPMTLPYDYYNFSMFLHMASIVLQREADGRLGGIGDFKTQLRRLLRGVLYGKASTRFNLERFALAYFADLPAIVDHAAEAGVLALPGRVIVGTASGAALAGVLSSPLTLGLSPLAPLGGALAALFSGCELKGGWQLGSAGFEDLNYWALAITHAYDVMKGDSNPVFSDRLPGMIETVKAQFGPDLPLSERKNSDKVPLVFDLAYDKVWDGVQPVRGNASLIGRHNPQGYIGTSFAWESGTLDGRQDSRRFDGGRDGDEALSNDEIACQYEKNVDVAREAAGLDYLLPTALLAYRKGGAHLGDVSGVGERTHTRLNARTTLPAEAVPTRPRLARPVPSCGRPAVYQRRPPDQAPPIRLPRVPPVLLPPLQPRGRAPGP